MYVGSYTEAVTLIKNEAIDQGQTTDTWYESEVESFQVTSAFNTASISAHEPANTFMRDSTPIRYNNIKSYDKLEKNIGKCVIDNF